MVGFREEQSFAPWVYWMLALSLFAALVAPPVAAWLARDATAVIPVLLVECFVAVIMLLPVNMLFMVTEIADAMLVVRFGRWLTLYRKSIPLNDIADARPVYYRPIWDAGGWGIRWGKFEGKRCAFLNARGDRGVLVTRSSGKRLIVGSQEPERLADAIRKTAGLSN